MTPPAPQTHLEPTPLSPNGSSRWLPALLSRTLPLFFCLALPESLRAQASLELSSPPAYNKPLSRVTDNRKIDGTRHILRVDPHKFTVEETLEHESGRVIWKMLRELDEAYQPLSAVKVDGNNQVISKHRYLCVKGRVEEEEILDAKENLVARMVFFYDPKGRMVRIDHFDAKGALVQTAKATVGKGVTPVVRDLGTSALPSAGTPPAPGSARPASTTSSR